MRYYVGAVLRSVPDWEEYIDVKAPKNYKDPAKIAQYIAERKAELQAETVTHPLAGTITSACVLTLKRDGTPDEENSFSQGGVGCGRMAVDYILNKSGVITDPSKVTRIIVSGCRLEATLRIMAIEYMIANGSLPYSLHWMFGHTAAAVQPDVPIYFDPARVICGYRGPHVPEIPYDKIAKRFGLPVPNEDDAEEMAIFALALSTRLGL